MGPSTRGIENGPTSNLQSIAGKNISHLHSQNAISISKEIEYLDIVSGISTGIHSRFEERKTEALRAVHLPIVKNSATRQALFVEPGKQLQNLLP